MPASFVCCYVQAGRETPMDAILELPPHCGEKFQKEQAEGKYYRQPSTLEAVSCTTTCINIYLTKEINVDYWNAVDKGGLKPTCSEPSLGRPYIFELHL
jgi:hypothetical protein